MHPPPPPIPKYTALCNATQGPHIFDHILIRFEAIMVISLEVNLVMVLWYITPRNNTPKMTIIGVASR